MRGGNRIICFTQRFGRLKIEKWTFTGPPNFLKLVEEAREKLKKWDPEMFAKMADTFTVMNTGDQLMSFAAWRYGVISNNYVEWGSEGVMTAWIYFLLASLEYRRNRWSMADKAYAMKRSREVRNNAALWLKQHNVPKELYETIQMDE
jgi:hypothetical protein